MHWLILLLEVLIHGGKYVHTIQIHCAIQTIVQGCPGQNGFFNLIFMVLRVGLDVISWISILPW